MAALRPLWMHWLWFLAHETRTPLNAARAHVRLIVRERSKVRTRAIEADVDRMLNRLDGQLHSLALLNDGLDALHSVSDLGQAVAAAVSFYNEPVHVFIGPDCQNLDTGCHSLGVIVTLLLKNFNASGRSVPFLTATRTDDGYEILISPGPHERGDAWADVTAEVYDEQAELAAIQAELTGSHRTLTVRSRDSQVAFIIRASAASAPETRSGGSG